MSSSGNPHIAEQPDHTADPAGFPYSAAGGVRDNTTTTTASPTAKSATAVKASDFKAAKNLVLSPDRQLEHPVPVTRGRQKGAGHVLVCKQCSFPVNRNKILSLDRSSTATSWAPLVQRFRHRRRSIRFFY